ncbi:MAG: hypothetical protein WDN08_06380 [Rhizomicrobium sp.]
MPWRCKRPVCISSRLEVKGPRGRSTSPLITSARVTGGALRQASEMGVERVAAGEVARRQMRHRVEAPGAQAAAGFLDAAVIVAGEEGDMTSIPDAKPGLSASTTASSRAVTSIEPRASSEARRGAACAAGRGLVASIRGDPAARDDEGFVPEPQPAMLLDDGLGRFE